MDIQLFKEDDGTFGAKITIEDEVIFWQWDTMELLWADIRWWLECAFDETQTDHHSKINKPIKPLIQFFHPSFQTHTTIS